MSKYFGKYDFARESREAAKPCKACTAFKDWAKSQGDKGTAAIDQNQVDDDRGSECPLDKDELGRSTWGFLHTMAAYYPDKPSEQQRQEMKCFFKIFSEYYPCHVCAEHLRKELVAFPPDTCSATTLSDWLCKMHNKVNVRLGKPEFDCSRVFERWRDGWKDGSCD